MNMSSGCRKKGERGNVMDMQDGNAMEMEFANGQRMENNYNNEKQQQQRKGRGHETSTCNMKTNMEHWLATRQ